MTTAQTDKPEPPRDELWISYARRDVRNGAPKPYLTISLDCLGQILADETAVIAPADVLPLMVCICAYARQAGHGNTDLASAMVETYTALIDGDDDDDGDAR